nr:TonB-dependent receptor [uncultured Carboxylicivirga sp.]
MNHIFKMMSLFVLLCLQQVIIGQNHVIKGNVVDEYGLPLPGVSVFFEGTTNGTITDGDGNYSIIAKDVETRLVFSFIGFEIQTLDIAGRSIINMKMKPESLGLDEVVVVGYGQMKKSDLSGSVVQVKADDLTQGNPSMSINQAMQGRVAGVQVNQNDGSPGAGVSITIRGANSFSTNSQPLFIVDGIPFNSAATPASEANADNNQTSNPLTLIPPQNIESVEILKDASATAIYGSRGANGVVIITTKRGKKGKDKVEVSTNFSVSKIANKIDVLNAYDYANYINEQTINDAIYMGGSYTHLPYSGNWFYNYDASGNIIPSSGRYDPSPEDFLRPRTIYDEYGYSQKISDTDWQDEIFQVGISQDYNVTVSGGDDNGWHSYYAGYSNQDGIIYGSGFERYSLGTNIGRKAKDWLELGMNINVSHSKTNFAKSNTYNTSIIRSALMFPSTHDPEMDPTKSDELNWLAANPYMYVRTAKDELVANNIFTSSYIEAKITDNLKFRQNIGISNSSNARSTYYGRHTQEGRPPVNGLAGQSDNWWMNVASESILTYDNKWNEIHGLNVVGAFTFEEGNFGSKSMSSSNFPTDATGDYDMSQGLNPGVPESTRGQQRLMSFLGRANYVLKDKYIFTASFRRDGSSKFVEGNKFANFASGAFAWRISEEEFIKNLNVFSNLKLRLSYGQTGNQGISSYQTLPMLGTANYPVGGSLGGGLAEISWRGPLNPDLKWETTDQYNVGLDMGFVDNRISLAVDMYYKKTNDLLQNVLIPSSSGFTGMWTNFGNVTNKGIELSGNFAILTKGSLKWNMDANISFNRNQIGGLDADQFSQALWYSADQVFIQRNGMPIGAIYGYVEDGFYNNEAEVRADPIYANASDAVVRSMVGEIKYRDLDGDGVITDADRTIIGDTNPDYIFGITNNFSYKRFTCSFFIQGTVGNDIFNGNLMDIQMGNMGNITQDAYDNRWTPENKDNAQWPKATGGYSRVWRLSDRYVEDGSYIRLKNVSFGYNLPDNLISGISNINVFVSANNLLTLTKYSWYDPDVNAFGGDASRRGVDIYSYPSSMTFSMGFKLSF